MFAKFKSAAFQGLDVSLVDVEVDMGKLDSENDKAHIVIVGLPDTAVKESKDRVMTAIKNASGHLGPVKCIVNLAPGDLKKEGPLYDLPIAIAVLASAKRFPENKIFSEYLIVGELGLSGETRPIAGALALAIFARELGLRGLILPADNAAEAAAVPGIEVIPIRTLQDAVSFFINPSAFPPYIRNGEALFTPSKPDIDFADIASAKMLHDSAGHSARSEILSMSVDTARSHPVAGASSAQSSPMPSATRRLGPRSKYRRIRSNSRRPPPAEPGTGCADRLTTATEPALRSGADRRQPGPAPR